MILRHVDCFFFSEIVPSLYSSFEFRRDCAKLELRKHLWILEGGAYILDYLTSLLSLWSTVDSSFFICCLNHILLFILIHAAVVVVFLIYYRISPVDLNVAT